MNNEFVCHWEHPKYFSVIKMKDMKTLFQNLEIELKDIKEETIKYRVYVTFTLIGTEKQKQQLNNYMDRIRTLS